MSRLEAPDTSLAADIVAQCSAAPPPPLPRASLSSCATRNLLTVPPTQHAHFPAGHEAAVLSIALVSEKDGAVLEVLHVMEHDTVEAVKLRLRARGCHRIAEGQLVRPLIFLCRALLSYACVY